MAIQRRYIQFQVIIVAVSPNGPVALVQDALYSKVDNSLSADTSKTVKLNRAIDRGAAAAQSLQIYLLILILTFLCVLNFTLIAFFCYLKKRRALQRANAIRRKTPTRVRFDAPPNNKISLARRISPFAREVHPVNVFSISPMPGVKKNDLFNDDSRPLKVHISSPL